MKKVSQIEFVSSIIPNIGKVAGFMYEVKPYNIYEICIDSAGFSHIWIDGQYQRLKVEGLSRIKTSHKLELLLNRFNRFKALCVEYAKTSNQDIWWKIYNENSDANNRLTTYKYARGFNKTV